MKKIILLLLAGALFTVTSCTKTGPRGPQGPAGYDGNANVIGSNPFLVSAWSYSNNVFSASFNDADLTSSVVNTGLVEIYKQYPDGSWTNLPDIDGVVSTVYNFYQGGFDIYVLTTNGSTTPAPGSINFRTVIIPSSLRLAHPNTNWKNYNEAMAVINAANATSSAQ
jgi:hypothetical protein